MSGVAAWRDEDDRYLGDPTFAMREREREVAYSSRTCGEKSAELYQQPLRGEDECFGVHDLGGELQTRAKARWRCEEAARFGEPPQPAVQLIEDRLTEATCDAVARQP